MTEPPTQPPPPPGDPEESAGASEPGRVPPSGHQPSGDPPPLYEPPAEPPAGSPPEYGPPGTPPPQYGPPQYGPPQYGPPQYGPGAPPPPQYGPPGPPPGYGAYPPGLAQQPVRPDEERLWSVLVHLSLFVFGLIAPIILMVTLGTRSPMIRHHAVEALNFHITVWIASIVAGLSIILVIGIILLPAVLIVASVFAIIAAVQASRGVAYRYPLTLRLVT